MEVFSQLRILFPDNSILCQADKKGTRTPGVSDLTSYKTSLNWEENHVRMAVHRTGKAKQRQSIDPNCAATGQVVPGDHKS